MAALGFGVRFQTFGWKGAHPTTDRIRKRKVCPTAVSAPVVRQATGAGEEMSHPVVTQLHVRTPLVRSEVMSKALGREVLLKLENVQPSGSFKIRGIGNLCLRALEKGTKRFVSSSGGNAGAAVAFAGKTLGVPVVVCVPSTTPKFMRDRLASFGAEVLVEGDVWMEADRLARRISEEGDSTYVSPFDHPDIWDGHGSLIEEIQEDMRGSVPSAVAVSVGGGGLLLGVLYGLEKVGWTHVQTIAVETTGAASFAATLEKREIVTLQAINTLAKSLAANCVSEEVLRWIDRLPITSYVVSDREAVEACGRFSVDHRFLVEPACGATLAMGYERLVDQKTLSDGPIVLVVCGGNIVTSAMLQSWAAQTGAEWDELV